MAQSDMLFDTFRNVVEKRGLLVTSVLEDGQIELAHDGTEFKVSLDNVRKYYESTGSLSKLNDLVEALVSYTSSLPDWQTACSTFLPIVVPADVEGLEVCHTSDSRQIR